MAGETTTQVITAVATLSAVVLTLVANAYLEHRRARDGRALETLRLASEHAKWLRDERMRAYAGLSIAGEEVMQFIRSDLLVLAEADTAVRRANTENRWLVLRTELRKAYNQVALFGAEDARSAAVDMWRIARNSVNDFLRDLGRIPETSPAASEVAEQVRSSASRLGIAGDRFLEACRQDLQRQ